MNTLSPLLRKHLERTVVKARDLAETGARAALESLAVPDREPYEHMGQEQRALRNRLRAHGRQLGDRRHASTGEQAIDHLVHECAYEQWHSMLFARFLAKNHLLIEPDTGVAVTLDECEQLAQAEGLDRWALAARFAHRMLPQVFRPDHPAFELQLAREHRLQLERLVEELPPELFGASDALGWVYQFWQTRMKKEVNQSGGKIGAEQLPAVTQLFTEPYMVHFLLHNSLGAWWVTRFPERRCPVDLAYLRKTDDGLPAAGRFEHWPDNLSEFRLLDPCCGSGHFLIAAFLTLVPMRMTLEHLTAAEATDAVMRDNLHGLELDRRCVAIAAFALALEAWRYPTAGGYRRLPGFHLAWCGQPVHGEREQWTMIAAGDARLEAGLGVLYDTFRNAPLFGSLIDPARTVSEDLFTAGFDALESLLDRALPDHGVDEEWRERSIAARGLVTAARLLSGRYHAVITNVPYLGREKHDSHLRLFLDDFHPLSKHDVATAFIERLSTLCHPSGHALLVLPQYWLYLSRYEKLRKKLLNSHRWHFLVTLGPGAFETISGEVVNTCLLSVGHPGRTDAGTSFAWLDVSQCRTATQKRRAIRTVPPVFLSQVSQLENPNTTIGYASDRTHGLLEEIAYSYQGLATSDNAQFVFNFWETQYVNHGWVLYQFAPDATQAVSGCSHILLWEDGKGKYADHAKALKEEGRLGGWKSGHAAWGKRGIAINRMGQLPVSLYYGTKFDCNVAVVIPRDEADIPAIWRYCGSPDYHEEVRKLNGKLSVTNATLTRVPYDTSRWAAAADQSLSDLYEVGTSDPSQWAFHGHPAQANAALQVAVARLLGYHWPSECDSDMELSDATRAWVERGRRLNSLEDDDGIVCLPSIRGEEPAEERLRRLLATAWGERWSDIVLADLLAAAGSQSLDDWLRNRFFSQHCALFHHRPFIWHVWDGRRRDGFHALLSYHKLAEGNGNGRRLLESLAYSYLGEWIVRQRYGVRSGEVAAEDRLAAALELRKRIVAILDGEPPFDIFVRWKPIDEQPIGWEPAMNDGVRLNIRPFMASDIPGGRKGAGILRSPPRIHWKNDRGLEPFRHQARFPWFWKNGVFVAARRNDLHLSNVIKHRIRASPDIPSAGTVYDEDSRENI